jgi:hypothetical protein
MTARAIIVVVALLCTAQVAYAQAPAEAADPEVAAIQEAYAANRFGEMHTLATALVAKRPDDAWVRYLAALSATRTLRDDEAIAQCDAGIVKAPDDGNLLSLRAQLYLAKGNERGARADARKVLATEPARDEALHVIATLDVMDRARERRSGTVPALRPGSASAFVDGLLAQIADGAAPETIARSFDPSIVARAATPTSREVVHAVTGAIESARRGDQEFLGWIVSPDERVDGAITWVDANVPVETTFTAEQRRILESALSDPQLQGTLPAEILPILLDMTPEDRAAVLDRRIGARTYPVLKVSFDTREGPGGWRVHDMLVDGVSIKAQVANYVRLAEVAAPEGVRRPRPSRAYRAGEGVGYLLGILLVVSLVVRFRRRT